MEARIKIEDILNENKIEDLKKFIKQRACINQSNQWLSYTFYLFQSLGVFLVSIGNAYKNDYAIWTGVGANSLASFIYIVINSNHKINNSLYNNINKIKKNEYIDEEDIEMIEKISNGSLTPKKISTV
jgi:hypothetical protein